MFDDEKIKLVEQMPEADTILIIWIKLLAQAGKTNASGYIYLSENIPFSDEMLSTIFNRPLLVVRLALQTLQQFGMIDVTDDNFISIRNWEKHQNVDGLAKIREQNRLRKQNQRERQKSMPLDSDSHVTVTHGHATELELDLELELEKESTKDIVDKSPIENLYNHYLSKNIIIHNKFTGPMKTAANARLKDYTYEQLVQAIDNYALIYSGDKYWFNTKYGFADLMRDKDIRKFIDDADPFTNFIQNDTWKRGGGNGYDRRGTPKDDSVKSKVETTNERRKRIAGIKSDRDNNDSV